MLKMGEVVISSDEMAERESDAPMEGGSSGGVLKWERFLPRMVLRVLLVEADDSTRQIITALLRKCNYKVAAVSDGFKAWELLNGRPHSIDLILTEYHLPSISGYPLLTLVMEHDICKNIPVIIMSSEDSISTVYKCMMRGAADYLVKPVRTNELKNLWQHVWRRQSSTAGTTREEDVECAALQKVEATAENNAASYRSSGNRDKELVEKGSDAQSSCTKPDVDADVRGTELDQSNEVNILTPEAVTSSERSLHGQEKESDEGFEMARSSQNKETNPDIGRTEANDAVVASGCNDFTVNSYKGAINLIGAFDNNKRSICMGSSSNYCGTRTLDNTQPELGLFLRQPDPSCLTDSKYRESNTVKRSDVSAFSRYISKPLHFGHSGFHNLQNQAQESTRNTEEDIYCADKGSNTDNSYTGEGFRNLGSAQTGHSEYYAQQSDYRVFPGPIPVKEGVRNQSTDYNCPEAYHSQSSPLLRPSPSAATQQEPLVHIDCYQQSSYENNNFGDQKGSNSSNRSRGEPIPDLKFDFAEDHRLSANTDEIGNDSSSFCNRGGTLTHLNSMDGGSICGSNENHQIVKTTSVGEGQGRSIQREAALAKFRLKRKDRCYEKKVRYESRKKLAEQRPRVKGQFVRQYTQCTATDSAPEE